jgi:hypothetical protein
MDIITPVASMNHVARDALQLRKPGVREVTYVDCSAPLAKMRRMADTVHASAQTLSPYPAPSSCFKSSLIYHPS